jgi:cytochrome P450
VVELLRVKNVALIAFPVHWVHEHGKLPGPKHMAVSDIFSQWRAFVSMDMLHYAPVLHRIYGPIVRIGPNRLAIEGSVCWPEVYGARSTSDEDEFSKIPGFTFPNDHLALLGASREDHRRQRRQLSHAFSATALQEQAGIIVQYIDKFVSQLTACAKQGQPVNIVNLLNYTTFDIIGDLIFADSFHSLDGDTTFVDNLFLGIPGGAYRQFLLQFPVLKPFLALYVGLENLHKASVTAKENFLLGRLKGQARMAMGAEPKDGRRDFATYMLRKGKSETAALSDEEVQGLSSVLVVAGSETTATALSEFTFLYGTHPKKKRILVDEFRAAFTDESEITIASSAKLPYLHAAIEETLRLYSPAAVLPSRVSPGAQVNGQWIPRGVSSKFCTAMLRRQHKTLTNSMPPL